MKETCVHSNKRLAYLKNCNGVIEIKILMLQGKISYDEAKYQAMPIIDDMNVRASRIAKEFGKKHIPFTFAKLFR